MRNFALVLATLSFLFDASGCSPSSQIRETPKPYTGPLDRDEPNMPGMTVKARAEKPSKKKRRGTEAVDPLAPSPDGDPGEFTFFPAPKGTK